MAKREVRSVDLIPVFEALGLPRPEPEYPVCPGREWRADYAWPAYRVSLERQGATWGQGHHTRGQGYSDDVEKLVEAQIAGWLVVWVTADQLRKGVVWDWVRRALEARGWPPPPGGANG